MVSLKKKYICLICHDDVKRPCFLNLNCECIYECHFKCFNEWYKIKNECIICHKITNGKPFWRKLKKRRKKRRTPPRIRLTTAEIERRLELLPYDNENERKTIKIVFFLIVVFWFVYTYLK